jgi:DNA-binding NarL/FixJ family response regulator
MIYEDEALLRSGLTAILTEAGFDVSFAAEDASNLLHEIEVHQPDLVLTDIRMPPTYTYEGLTAARQIRSLYPDIGVVILSHHVQRRHAAELLRERPTGIGYLLKQRVSDVDTFLADIRRVAAGGTALDPEVVSITMSRARTTDASIRGLTDRQQEVLSLMAEGHSNVEIASRLGISEKGVVAHTSHIYDSIGLPPTDLSHRRVLAVLYFLST